MALNQKNALSTLQSLKQPISHVLNKNKDHKLLKSTCVTRSYKHLKTETGKE